MPHLIVKQMLDRVAAPHLLPEEVRVHVKPFCERQKVSADAALGDYIDGLVDAALPSGGVRLNRAAQVLRCIGDVDQRARCLLKLLCHWHGAEVPSELEFLVAEAASWPETHRERLEQRLALMGIQRVLAKH